MISAVFEPKRRFRITPYCDQHHIQQWPLEVQRIEPDPIGGAGLAVNASCIASVTFTPTRRNLRTWGLGRNGTENTRKGLVVAGGANFHTSLTGRNAGFTGQSVLAQTYCA